MPNQRLTLAQAKAILVATGTANNIAKRFDVSHQTVRLYKNLQTALAKEAHDEMRGEGWEVVPLDSNGSHKFTTADVATIKESEGTSKELAEAYGCSASMIRMIRTGKAYV